MTVVLVVTIASLLASTDEFDHIKVPLTSIPGQHARCTSQDVSKMTQEMITASVERVNMHVHQATTAYSDMNKAVTYLHVHVYVWKCFNLYNCYHVA